MPVDTQIVRSKVAAGNADYVVPGSAEFELKAVSAEFSDNGAGSDWLPAVILISDSGHVIVRALDQGVRVAAGGSADVSWFPGGGLAGVGIRYDTPNDGDWLQVLTEGLGANVTTGVRSYSNVGVGIVDEGGTGTVIGSNAGGDVHIDSDGEVHITTHDTFSGGDVDIGLIPAGVNRRFEVEGAKIVNFGQNGAVDEFNVFFTNPARFVNTGDTNTSVIHIILQDTNYFSIFNVGFTKEFLRVGSDGVFMFQLPTVNPGVTGQLWNSGGFVKIV